MSGALGQATLRDRVVHELRRAGALSRAELARRLGTSRSTMSVLVSELLTSGRAVELAGFGTPRPGRPGIRVQLAADAGAAAGVDFGHRHVHAVVCDLAHQVLAEGRADLPLGHDADLGVATAGDLLDQLIDRAGVGRDQLIAVGVGLPGPIDLSTGMATPSSVSPGWVGVPATDLLAARLGRPVHLDNDANLGARAELVWGAGQGVADLVYVKLGTGVGAGIVADGRVLRGATGSAGEIGHVTVDETGALCRCGNRGCLEGVVGTEHLLRLLRPLHGRDLTVDRVCQLAAAGDRASRRVLGDAGRALGVTVANLVNVLNPRLVVVGGRLADAGDVLLDPLREAVSRCAVPTAAEHVRIVPAQLGARAEALGGVAMVLQEADRYTAVPSAALL